MVRNWIRQAGQRFSKAVETRLELGAQRGLATAEYAIVLVAAAGFAGLLVVILRSEPVREMLLGIVRDALSF